MNDSDVGFNETFGDAAATAVPVTGTVWGDPAALSVMVNDEERVPAAVGLNVTEIVQDAPTAKLEPQLLDWLKSKGLPPVKATEENDAGAVPPFFTVTDCVADATPTVVDAKVREMGLSVSDAEPTFTATADEELAAKLASPE